eukprot:c6427_g1_i1.p1 GENE.c6427_g1_i1~~c6427_g1_i1.p1  ORF type:complete len:258 (-),score=39.59 c6427_g1_i1:83-856(-)
MEQQSTPTQLDTMNQCTDVLTPVANQFMQEAWTLVETHNLTDREKIQVQDILSLFNSFCLSIIPKIMLTELHILEMERTQSPTPSSQSTMDSPEPVAPLAPKTSNAKPKPIDELNPDSPIEKIPGLGRTYSGKLRELGYLTVRDLASVTDRTALLSQIRKDRGCLTDAKFAAMIDQAKGSVANGTTSKTMQSAHPNKPVRTLGKRRTCQIDFETLMPSKLQCSVQGAPQQDSQHNWAELMAIGTTTCPSPPLSSNIL